MHPLLGLFIEFAEKEGITDNTFIVGGAVRDIILNKELKDIDIAINGDAINIARRFADEAVCSFIFLDEEFGIARVVKNGQSLDISIMRGDSIYTDLSERDITINAMAIPLTSLQPLAFSLNSLNLIDPYNGKNDLFNRIIKMLSEENLIKDPLRILRVYRFASSLKFSIEEDTLNATKRLAPLITSAAVERITEEMRYIVRLDDSYKTIKALMDNGIFTYILPEVRINPLRLYKTTEELLSNPSDSLQLSAFNLQPLIKYFETDYRKICLKLSTLFSEPATAKQSATRLKMSRKEADFIHKMVLNRHQILNLYKKSKGLIDKTIVVGVLKEFQDDVYPLIILFIANSFIQPSGFSPSLCQKLLTLYHEEFKPKMALLPIVTGNDLIRIFHLKPSPLFKKILSTIEDMFLEGRINSREEALHIIKDMLRTQS